MLPQGPTGEFHFDPIFYFNQQVQKLTAIDKCLSLGFAEFVTWNLLECLILFQVYNSQRRQQSTAFYS